MQNLYDFLIRNSRGKIFHRTKGTGFSIPFFISLYREIKWSLLENPLLEGMVSAKKGEFRENVSKEACQMIPKRIILANIARKNGCFLSVSISLHLSYYLRDVFFFLNNKSNIFEL